MLILLLFIFLAVSCSFSMEEAVIPTTTPYYEQVVGTDRPPLLVETAAMEPVDLSKSPVDTKPSTFFAAAEQGAVIVGWEMKTRRCTYKKKCESCGFILPGSTSTTLNAASTYKSSFNCSRCRRSQQVAISCSGGN